MNDFRLSRQYQSILTRQEINNSEWFCAIAKNAYRNSERFGNRIKVFFNNENAFNKAVQECETRNISCVCGPHATEYGRKYLQDGSDVIDTSITKIIEWRLDIMMNWKENKPTRAHRNKNLILN